MDNDFNIYNFSNLDNFKDLENKTKYLKYKSEYSTLKYNYYKKLENINNLQTGGKDKHKHKHNNKNHNKKRHNKIKLNEEQKRKYEYLMIKSNIDYQTLLGMSSLKNIVLSIDGTCLKIMGEDPKNFKITDKTKSVTVIGIGDSPSIILQLLEKFFPIDYTTHNKIKYLSASALYKIMESNDLKEIGKEKFKNLGEYIDTDYILWVDYVFTGESFYNFKKILPKDVKDKSYFYVYGSTIKKSKDFSNQVLEDKSVYYYDTSNNEQFEYYLATLIGHSEKHSIRCLPYDKINESYKIKLYETKELPITKDKGCVEYAQYLFDELIGN